MLCTAQAVACQLAVCEAHRQSLRSGCAVACTDARLKNILQKGIDNVERRLYNKGTILKELKRRYQMDELMNLLINAVESGADKARRNEADEHYIEAWEDQMAQEAPFK